MFAKTFSSMLDNITPNNTLVMFCFCDLLMEIINGVKVKTFTTTSYTVPGSINTATERFH